MSSKERFERWRILSAIKIAWRQVLRITPQPGEFPIESDEYQKYLVLVEELREFDARIAAGNQNAINTIQPSKRAA